jgi:hypothetical protein|tara:strand:+ start:1286 stop:1399 length:114 start_codon:yes stop_codon:yes gene_type:complete
MGRDVFSGVNTGVTVEHGIEGGIGTAFGGIGRRHERK